MQARMSFRKLSYAFGLIELILIQTLHLNHIYLLKEIRRQLNNPLMEDYVEYLNRLSTETIEVESLMCYDQFVEALEKGKQYLSPRQRTIFEMNKEYGMSIPEISEKLSITNQVTRNQLCMALKILRVELRQYYPLLLLFLKDF